MPSCTVHRGASHHILPGNSLKGQSVKGLKGSSRNGARHRFSPLNDLPDTVPPVNHVTLPAFNQAAKGGTGNDGGSLSSEASIVLAYRRTRAPRSLDTMGIPEP